MSQNNEKLEFEKVGHIYTIDGKPLMGVTTVLGIIGKPALIGWAAKMTAEWLKENCKNELLDDVLHYDVTDADMKQAVVAHAQKKNEGGVSGKAIHKLVEDYVNWCIKNSMGLPILGNEEISLKAFINWAIKENITFLESEKMMYSKDWWVGGTCDLVFKKNGKTFIGDIKTQAKLWDRTPFVQMAAYAQMYKETTGTQIDGTCVILLPQGTSEIATYWEYNHEEDIKSFEAALRLYKSIPL